MNIYVMPTTTGIFGQEPPRALLFEGPEPRPGEPVVGVTWSREIGTWVYDTNELPVNPELADFITAHAKSLGVEW